MSHAPIAKLRRRRITTQTRRPGPEAPEGLKAAWWREHKLKVSRPHMAELVGVSVGSIVRYEKMLRVPLVYHLACAAIHIRDLEQAPEFIGSRFQYAGGETP